VVVSSIRCRKEEEEEAEEAEHVAFE